MTRPQSIPDPSGLELTAAVVEKITDIRRQYADLLDDIAQMQRRQVAKHAGYPSLQAYLVHATRMSRRNANRLVAQAEQTTETLTPTGHVTPAALPKVRELVRAGAVDGEHVDAITAAIKQLPETTSVEVREIVESTLVATARTSEPRVVAEHGRILLERIDHDGRAPDDDAQPAVRNELHLRPTRDGGCVFRGRLAKEPTEALLTMLGVHGKPQSAVAGVPDPRSEAERHGDGLAAVVGLAIASSDNPDHGGEKPHVNLLVDATGFLNDTGVASADSGRLFCPAAVQQQACDAKVIPIVMDEHGAPLQVGRAHRVVTTQQRQALIARDKGCAFPGCHLPPRWADAHHVIHWKDGGPTNLDNLVLLCRRHHTLLHKSSWIIQMINGIPWFQPPRWIDPQQQLIRNVLRQ